MKYLKKPLKKDDIPTIEKNRPDDVFITCASPEKRCLGSITKFSDYRVKMSYVFEYSHENIDRSRNLKEMKKHLSKISKVKIIKTREENPIPGIHSLLKDIPTQIQDGSPMITLDISTFRKNHLLILLKALDLKGMLKDTRIVYTEPVDYGHALDRSLSFGIKDISVITTFTGLFNPSKDIQLVLFLGYEGDRAFGLLDNLDPHDCIVIIAKPAYRKSWEGRTEKLNNAIIKTVGRNNVKYIDSRDPAKVAMQLKEILSEPQNTKERFNHYIAPLGTKPQTLGIYYYVSKYGKDASIIYASPLRHNHKYLSNGIGPTWELPNVIQ